MKVKGCDCAPKGGKDVAVFQHYLSTRLPCVLGRIERESGVKVGEDVTQVGDVSASVVWHGNIQ